MGWGSGPMPGPRRTGEDRPVTTTNELKTHARRALSAVPQGFALSVMGLVAGVVLFVFLTLAESFVLLGVGVLLVPPLVLTTRRYTRFRRRLAHDWCGIEIAEPYRPRPVFKPGVVGGWQRCTWVLTDSATWRDQIWLLVDATAGFTLALLPATLVVQGLFGFVLSFGVWRPIAHSGADGYWYLFLHVTDQTTADLSAVLGLAQIALGLWVNPKLMRRHAMLTRWGLGPTPDRVLEQRVTHLTETRSDALDVQAAELRRIERDLHDGAQARLVAMGMNLGAAERLIEDDPAAARKLLAETRDASAAALVELRDLVRGIHPPVLAERGLGDAVRALALAGALKTEVTTDLHGRFEAPVEAAAYFAVSELLTNAAKHSGAQRVWIDLRYDDGMLRVTVNDDGTGGADLAGGTGLRGVERRLATFDGVLALSSPRGGPTMVTLEIPCTQSSPQH
jgi:signal transduction histidine kinase